MLAVLLLGLPALATAAPQPDKESPGHEERDDSRAAKIIIRSDAEKKRRQALRPDDKNSNRQSDPDSARGLERAEERRSEQADAHAQAGKEDRGWYEYLFGKQDTDKKSEGSWYGYLFGRPDEVAKPEKKDDDDDWWWPFD